MLNQSYERYFISIYKCFESYLYTKGLNKTLPTIENLEDGLKIYHIFYKPKEEEKYGVVALELQVVSKYQNYKLLVKIRKILNFYYKSVFIRIINFFALRLNACLFVIFVFF